MPMGAAPLSPLAALNPLSNNRGGSGSSIGDPQEEQQEIDSVLAAMGKVAKTGEI